MTFAASVGDPDFLPRFREGDKDALRLVYQSYVDAVTRVVASALRRYGAMGHHGWRALASELPDLVQEVFTRAFEPRTRRGFDGLREYGPYLGQIARNVVVDHLRRRQRRVASENALVLEEVSLAPATPATATGFAEADTMALVSRYIAGLSPDLRRVHDALYVQGMSQRDAAVALGLGRQVVRTMEAKLRDGLRGELARSSGTGDPALVSGVPATVARHEKAGTST